MLCPMKTENSRIIPLALAFPALVLSFSLIQRAQAGSCVTSGPLTIARQHHTATLLPNGKVLVVGGCDRNENPLSNAELYDPVTGRSTVTGALTTARERHSATLLPNGKVLVAGGRSSRGVITNSAEIYDPATGTWTASKSLT